MHSLANEEPKAAEEAPEDEPEVEVEVDPEDASAWFDPSEQQGKHLHDSYPIFFIYEYNMNHYMPKFIYVHIGL